MPVKDLAVYLQIDLQYLKNKINYLRAKLYCKTRTSIVVKALKNKIIKLNEI